MSVEMPKRQKKGIDQPQKPKLKLTVSQSAMPLSLQMVTLWLICLSSTALGVDSTGAARATVEARTMAMMVLENILKVLGGVGKEVVGNL